MSRFAQNIFWSSLFFGLVFSGARFFMCRLPNLVGVCNRYTTLLSAFLSGFNILCEIRTRRVELNYYFLPKVLQSIWSMLETRGFVTNSELLKKALLVVSMGLLAMGAKDDAGLMKPSYKGLFRALFP